MLERLEQQTKLTANQWKIMVAAILGDMLDFFDYFLNRLRAGVHRS